MPISITIFLIIIWPLGFLFAKWLVHIRMVKLFTLCYGKSNFKTFKKHFDMLDGFWIQYIWDDSLFYFSNTIGDSKFYADIIQFEGKGMILNPVDYIRACLYAKKYINKNFKKMKISNGNS